MLIGISNKGFDGPGEEAEGAGDDEAVVGDGHGLVAAAFLPISTFASSGDFTHTYPIASAIIWMRTSTICWRKALRRSGLIRS